MRERHLTRMLLEAVRRGEVEAETFVQHLVQHLVTVCPDCDLAYQDFLATRGEPRPVDVATKPLLAVLERWRSRLGDLEAVANREVAELRKLAPDERVGRVRRAVKRFRNPLLAERLLDEARDLVYRDAEASRQLTELALEVTGRLSVGEFGLELPHELLLRCRVYRANALRAAGRLAEAERAIAEPLRQVATNPDPLGQAEMLSLAASLRHDQLRFGDALALLDRAARLYRELGEPRLEARALLKTAQVYREMGAVDEAIEAARSASDGFRASGDGDLQLCAQHEIICALADGERFVEARKLMAANQALYDRFSDRRTHLRRRWVQGRVAQGLGELREAEAAFEEVRSGYLKQKLPHDAAIASLDLARLLMGQGRLQEVRKLADEMLPKLPPRRVHREARSILLLYRDAAKIRTAPLGTSAPDRPIPLNPTFHGSALSCHEGW